jgi:hypothetical protein
MKYLLKGRRFQSAEDVEKASTVATAKRFLSRLQVEDLRMLPVMVDRWKKRGIAERDYFQSRM